VTRWRSVRAGLGAFLRQAADLIDHPERPPGWGYEDPVLDAD